MRLHHQPSPPWLATSLLLAAHLILASGHQLRASTVHLPDPAAFGARAAAAQAAAAAAAGGGPHAGTFSDPLPLQPPPSTTPWLSMADGHFKLSAAAANLCRYKLETWAAQRKLVLAYPELQGGPLPRTQFAICTDASGSEEYVLDIWLLSCERALADEGGADVAEAGCQCQLADGDVHAPCPTGMFGWRSTTHTQLGRWHYVVVQANPPETGDEPGRTFTIDVDRHPPD